MNKEEVISHLNQSIISSFDKFSIKASGWSMQPLIQTNDKLIVEKISTKYQKGDIVLYLRKSDSVFVAHRIIKRYKTCYGYKYVLKGDASPFVDNYLIGEDEIIGLINEVQHSSGKISKVTGFKCRMLQLILPHIPIYSFWTYQCKPFLDCFFNYLKNKVS